MHQFLKQYNEVAVPKLKEHSSYASVYQIPKIEKVVVNIGIGSAIAHGKNEDDIARILSTITGQKPIVTKARKAIAGFKIRANMPVGMKVTLRGARMHDFMSKLTTVVLPRTRDFRGLKPTGIATDGNLHIGIKDSMIFPEVAQETFSQPLQVTVVSTAQTKEEARVLFEALGFVFQTNQ